jgi:hypothetical protein
MSIEGCIICQKPVSEPVEECWGCGRSPVCKSDTSVCDYCDLGELCRECVELPDPHECTDFDQ